MPRPARTAKAVHIERDTDPSDPIPLDPANCVQDGSINVTIDADDPRR